MRSRLALAITLAGLGLAACGSKHAATETGGADTNSSSAADTNISTSADVTNAGGSSSPANPAASSAQTFVNTAASSDAFEIQSSELAATHAASAKVKSFAKRMVTAHTQSTAKLKSAASSASPPLTPDPTLTADQQQKVASLKSQNGAAFDSAYIDAQISAHQATLDALKSYSASGDVPGLKAFASEMLPIVTAHLNSAKALKK